MKPVLVKYRTIVDLGINETLPTGTVGNSAYRPRITVSMFSRVLRIHGLGQGYSPRPPLTKRRAAADKWIRASRRRLAEN